MSTRWRAVLAIGLLAAAVLLAARPAVPAQAAMPDRWGFAYLDNPSPPPGFVMDVNHQWGSWKPSPLWATAAPGGVGFYRVTFPHLGGPGGIVHVTAVSPGPTWCQAVAWLPAGLDENVYVRCFRPGGVPAASRFTVLYTASTGPAPAGAYAYVFFRPPLTIVTQANSGGGVSTVTPVGTGTWRVVMTGVGFPVLAGNLQVTAVSGSPTRCKPIQWLSAVAAQTIVVRCVNQANVPVSSAWTLSYHRQRAVTGGFPPTTTRWGYVWPALAPAPPGATNFNSLGAANTIVIAGLGLHLVAFPAVGVLPDHVQVTAFGPTTGYCNLNSIWATPGTTAVVRDVACYGGTGLPSNEPAFVTYTTRL